MAERKKERRARKPEEEPAQPPPVSLPKIPEVQKRADPMMNMGSLSRAPQRPTPSTGQRQLLPSISDVGKTPMGVDTPAGRAVKRRIAHDCLVPVPIIRQDTTTKGRVPFPGSQSGVGYSGPHATSQTQPQFLKPIQNGQSKPTFLAPQRSIQSIAIQRQAARPLRQPPTIPMAARKPQLPTVLGTGESSCATNSQRSLPQGPSLVKENANSSAVVQQQQQLVGSSNSSIGRNLVDPSRLFRDIAHSYHQRQVPSTYSYHQRQTALNPPGNATSATSSHSAPQLSAIPTIPITDREPQHPAAKTPVLGTAQAAYTKNNEVMPMEEARRRARIKFFNNSYQMHRAANRLKGAGLYREIDELVAHFNSIDRTTAVLEKDMDALNLKAFLGEWIVATFSPRQAAALIVQSKKNEPRTDSERTESSSTSNTEH